MVFILPNFHYTFLLARLWCFCRTAGASGEQLLSLPSAARSGPMPQQRSDPAGCICAQKAKSIYVTFFLQHMPIFQYSTLHCSLSLWVCKLRRLRKPPCLLFSLSLSHDFLLKAQAHLRQSVRFNILFKLNVLGWPNQMLAGWPQEWEPRYSVI